MNVYAASVLGPAASDSKVDSVPIAERDREPAPDSWPLSPTVSRCRPFSRHTWRTELHHSCWDCRRVLGVYGYGLRNSGEAEVGGGSVPRLCKSSRNHGVYVDLMCGSDTL